MMEITYTGDSDRGEIIISDGKTSFQKSYSRDKKQELLLCQIHSTVFQKGWKMFYARTPEGLIMQIKKRITDIKTITISDYSHLYKS